MTESVEVLRLKEEERVARMLQDLRKRVERLEIEVSVLQQQRDGLL